MGLKSKVEKILEKIAEEAGEVLIASKNDENLSEVNSGLDLIVKIPFEDFVGYTKGCFNTIRLIVRLVILSAWDYPLLT